MNTQESTGLPVLNFLRWIRTGHKPEAWSLGKWDGENPTGIVARIERLQNGSWRWSIVKGDIQGAGIEPSRETATEACHRFMESHLKDDFLRIPNGTWVN